MVANQARLVAGLLLLAVALGPPTGAAVVGGGPAVDSTVSTVSGGYSAALGDVQAVPETDNTVTRIVLYANGTATWTLSIRTRLSTDRDVEEYRAFQGRFRENTSTYLDPFRESIAGVVENARTVTGREMYADEFRASTSIQSVPRHWGVVTYEFRWTGFAAVDGNRLRVGDVFEGGLLIVEGDSLQVVAPAGYRIESADPAPDETGDRVVTWRGREDFADGRPHVVLARAETVAQVETSSDGSRPRSWPWFAFLGGVALIVTVVISAVVISAVGYRRWRHRGGRRGVDVTGEVAVRGAGAESAAGDHELLADEDYVRKVLSEHGGRMRQKEIKDALDWSRSKTSRVLGRMEADGQVRKLQLGRENVIDLAEEAEE